MWYTVLADEAYIGQPGITSVFCPQPGMFVWYTVFEDKAYAGQPGIMSVFCPQLGMFVLDTVLEDKVYFRQSGIMSVFCPQLGMFVLYTVSQMATDQLKPHLVSMLQLLNEKLNDTQNYMVPYYAIRSVIAGASLCPGLNP